MTNTEMKKVLSLNPYYTGIHLHTKKELQRLTEKRLNPYYTGIHLHVNEIYKLLIKKVLILIILEYIYMKPH